ncbi:MAG: hypothetical protein K0U98_25770 [Deltaproteobacteria bacterium]|nr:hypothetical protein [Deltaproteobacteria bacterium]
MIGQTTSASAVAVAGINLTGSSTRGLRWLAVLGALSLALGAVMDPQRGWASVLFCGVSLLGLGLAGLYFIAIHDAADAGWATAFRRIPEAMMGLIPVGSLFILLAITLGGRHLYSWLPDGFGGEGFKGLWLQSGFFYLRSVIYLAVFGFFGWAVRRSSHRRTESPSGVGSKPGRGLAAAFLLLGSVTLTLASVDWLQSLEPHWFSTMWGVYEFANLFAAGLAALLLLAAWLDHHGYSVVNREHLFDLGKLLFAMSTFWMYIWFSQAMLIWYSNLAEEAIYFTDRLSLGWGPMMVVSVLLNWVVPFFVLMSRRAKRSQMILVRVSMVVLVGHALDLFVEILPPVVGGKPSFGLAEVGAGLLVVALLFLVSLRQLRQAALVPLGDPYLEESLHYHS